MNLYMPKKNSLLVLIILFVLFANQSFSQSNDYKMKTVCIDAGHGGAVPGAVTNNVYEKNIVLDVVLKLGSLIESKHKDIKVVYTRKKDVDVGLYERAEIANKSNADLFISIHANSTLNKKAYGTETFVFGLNKTDANLKVAMKENDVIKYEKDYETKYQGFDPSKPESYIMFNMVQNCHREQSIDFADYVETSFKKSGRHSRGVQEASLIVLIKTAMPAVLVELGFISNSIEEQYLMSSIGQDIIANNLFNAFENYKNKVEKKNNIVSANEIKKELVEETKPEIVKPNVIEVVKSKIVENTDSPSIKTFHFGVQFASGSRKISNEKYKRFSQYGEVEELFTKGIYRYYVKTDCQYQNAVNLQKKIKDIQTDCFIIAVNNGERISVIDARKLIN